MWSATPLYVNDTLYVGTPFYRIFALDHAYDKELADATRRALEDGNQDAFATNL